MSPIRRIAFALAFSISSCFAQSLVTVSCDAGSQATLSYTNSEGRRVNDTWVDYNNDGKIEFTVPKGTKVTIRKYSDGRLISYETTAN